MTTHWRSRRDPPRIDRRRSLGRSIATWIVATVLGWGFIALALFAFYELAHWSGIWAGLVAWAVEMVYYAADVYSCPAVAAR